MRTREQDAARKRAAYQRNPEKLKARAKAWRASHPEFERLRSRRRRSENPEYHDRLSAEWKHRNRERVRQRNRIFNQKKRMNDPGFRIRLNLSRRINGLVRGYKSGSIISIVGCEIIELRRHLESLFHNGMDWTNYGVNGWEIDHKIPCSAFDLTDADQQRKCFHWSNLQPLWAFDNRSKGNRFC